MKKLVNVVWRPKSYSSFGLFLGLVCVSTLSFPETVCAVENGKESLISVTQQKTSVSGVVKDENGEPLPGVNVVVKGTTNGTVTDGDGQFSLDLESQVKFLTFSYIGRKSIDVPVKRIMNVVLESDAQALQEVVVSTGYMVQRKADLTGSVAVVSAEDITKTPNANAMKSLQGKIPGVYVTADGNPAENVGIQIRGITSMRSAPPLIVLDGQPVDVNLRDINPNDIASIQVLKDAASASIYGSRAASGVILIETKKGKSGSLKIDYEGYVGISSLVNAPDMLNTEEYGRAIWQAAVNDGQDPKSAIRIYDYDWGYNANGVPELYSLTPIEWLNDSKTMRSADTDWFKEGTRLGVQTNHQLTVSNGAEKSRSLFSLNYYENQGTQIYSYFKRYSARLNSEYDLVKDRLKVGENLTLSHLQYADRNQMYQMLVLPAIVPVHTVDGQGWGGSAMGLGMDDYHNPVRDLNVFKDHKDHFLKILGNVYADIAILKNLHLRTTFGVDYSNAYSRKLDYTWEEAGGKSDKYNGVNNDQRHTISWTWTNTLTYNLELNNKHFLDVLLGQEAFHLNSEWFGAYRDGIYLENMDYGYLDAASGDTKTMYGSGDEYALLSYFAKANYSYESKYLLSATLRYDGASKFGPGNRWGVFPAFSAGWRIKGESFMDDVNFLTDLKIRASWGMNGNSNIPTNALTNLYLTDFDGTSYPIAGNETGSIPSGYRRGHLGNENLKWEATKQTNIGFDFGLFEHTLTGSFDYFYKKTDGMLYEPPYIAALGEGGYRWINAADMVNNGIEVNLNYSNTNREFKYNIGLNFSSFKNKIDNLPENVKYNYGGNGLLDNILGRPLNSMYGLVADGLFRTQEEVDNAPQQQGKGVGRIRFKDLDGDGRIDERYDRTWIGISDPDLMAGLNFDAQYKNFDLTVFFQGVFGNQVVNRWKELSDFWNIGVQNDRNHPVRVLDAWSPTNPESNIPSLSRGDVNGEKRLSTYFIENGSYIKLRSVELGYSLPKSIVEKAYMQKLRVYVSAQNLFTLKKWWGDDKFTGTDPENPDYGYQRPLSMLFGVNVTF